MYMLNGPWTKNMERMVDLLLDTRLYHAWPHALIRNWRFNHHFESNIPQSFQLCVTVDLEGNFRDPGNVSAALSFLPKFDQWCRIYDVKATFYVQGDIVTAISKYHDVLTQHDLGLHGLHHEVWGRSRWWQYSLNYASQSLREKEKRLEQALNIFQKQELPIPKHFRAPYLNANRSTLVLLKKYGFVSDSSPASYLGSLPLPRQREGLWEIPLTTRPYPQRINQGLQKFQYPEFSLGTLLTMPFDVIVDTINVVTSLQNMQGYPPHIILLIHPWEFFSAVPSLSYCSEKNYEWLGDLINKLSEKFDIETVTITEMTSQLTGSLMRRPLSNNRNDEKS